MNAAVDLTSTREMYLLGALMLDNSQLSRIALRTSDFTTSSHREVFTCIRRMISDAKVVDALTVAEQLERESRQSGWLPVTANMVQACLAPANAPAYAEWIRKASTDRQAAEVGRALVDGLAVDEAIRKLIEINTATTDYSCHQYEAAQAAIAEMDRASGGGLPGVTSGMRDIDAMLGGFHDGDLIVVAARPAMGKTAFMLNLLVGADKPVGAISGEQGRAQIGMRLLAIRGPISLHRMRTGALHDEEWARVNRVMTSLKDRPAWIYDRPGPTIEDIERQARTWKFEKNIGILMVDYLQKISGGNGRDYRLQIGDVAARLKNLARELQIPVVALAQVNRDVEKQPMGEDGMGRMPHMSDIAESGSIEAEADVVATLYRPEVYMDQQRFKGLAYVNVGKNRHGPTGYKTLAWRGEYLQFGDLAHGEPGELWGRTA